MADIFETNSTPPLYRAIPVLEVADEAPAVLDVLPADNEADAPLDVLPASPPSRSSIGSALPLAYSCVRAVHSMLEWLFGVAVLMVGLAVLAALPLLQFLSLGYLLEAGGRVARTGRLRDGFIGVRRAAQLGGLVLGCWLMLLPARFVADLAYSAQIIDPGGRVAAGWRIGLFVLIGLTALHIGLACARGGRLRYFFWPFNFIWVLLRLLRGGYYSEARDAVWDTAVSLRLPYYFSLGFRGFVGALTWLALPVTLLALGRLPPPLGPLVGFLGALLLALVLVYLPFLQMRLAMTNRLSAVFEILEARRNFRRAPWAFAFAFVVTLLFALPLYLLKIEMVPREAAWLPSLVFIAFIFPARLLTGWAMGRAVHRAAPRHWFFRWTGRLPFLP
ncbi:MAG: hypothetical protein ACRELF_07505, partial [Gemmataceae bacterium]